MLGRIILRLTRKVAWVLPEKFIYFLSKNLSLILFFTSSRHRKIALNNLKIAFPDKDFFELLRISKQSFENIAKSIVETLWFSTKSKKFQKRFFYIEGAEHLDNAFKSKNGVVVIIAHFGNFPLLVRALVLEGYKVNLIVRNLRDERTSPIILDMLAKQRINCIFTKPERICVRESLHALRDNQLLILEADQDAGADGMFVNFFGRATSTPIGAAVFSLRNKSPIIPMFIIREKADLHRIVIEPVLKFKDLSFTQENIRIITQKISDVIERYIVKYPAQWGWIGRRWRNSPDGKN